MNPTGAKPERWFVERPSPTQEGMINATGPFTREKADAKAVAWEAEHPEHKHRIHVWQHPYDVVRGGDMEEGYDEECARLARHFVPDGTDEEIAALALAIQRAVEANLPARTPTIDIVVNTDVKQVHASSVSYEDVAQMAFPGAPARTWTIVYRTRQRGDVHRQGIMHPGQIVDIEQGMKFDVADTGEA